MRIEEPEHPYLDKGTRFATGTTQCRGGAAIFLYSGNPVDAVAIAAIVLINAVIGFVQEFKASVGTTP